MADKYGPLFTIRLGMHRALVVSNCEMAKACFTINDLQVSSRPRLISIKHMGYNHAMFGFAPYGTYWREIPKITTLHLLSNHRLELLKHTRISEVAIFLKQLYGFWSEKKNVSDDRALVEMKQWLGDMTLNVILGMVAGKRYSVGPGDVGGDERESRRMQEAIREFLHFLGLFVPGDAIPYFGWLDLGGYVEAMKKTAKELDDTFDKWLQEHKRKREEGTNQLIKEEQDFMDVMLSVLQDSDLASFDADTINKSTTLNTIAGGTDTTTVTVTWAISLSGRREFTEDCNIGGCHDPKGTRLITNLWKIQTDPKIWEDPLEFKPERFLTTHKDIDYRSQHFEYILFGSGRRACPGASFALQMVKFSLASFLHAFEISTLSDAPVNMTESFGLTNQKATPLEVLIKPRLPRELYVSMDKRT